MDDLLRRIVSINDPAVYQIVSRAMERKDAGSYQEAIDLLRSQESCLFQDAGILVLIAHCYILNDDLIEANTVLDAARQIDPLNAAVKWNECRLLLKSRDVIDALEIAKETHQKFPEDIEGLLILAVCFRANGQLENSLEILNRIILTHPNNTEAYVNRGLIMLSKGSNARALEDLDFAYKQRPGVTQIWDLLTTLKMQFGGAQNFVDAIQILEKMASKNPYNHKVYGNLGLCHQNIGNFNEAVSAYKKALSIKNDFFEIYINLGGALTQLERLDEAISVYSEAQRLQPGNADIYSNLGVIYKNKGDIEKAINSYDKSLSLRPDNANTYLNLGVALKAKGALIEAKDAYQKAILLNSELTEAYFNLGHVFLDLNRQGDAIESYRKALLIEPTNTEFLTAMTFALQKQGKHSEAVEICNRAIELEPENKRVKSLLIEILKDFKQASDFENHICSLDGKIKSTSHQIDPARSDLFIAQHIAGWIDHLEKLHLGLISPFSQIYKRNKVDLNCEQRVALFKSRSIIPEFCFGCFKVQIDVFSLIDLIRLCKIFYETEGKIDLTMKCFVETRKEISGFYKGLIYCRGTTEATKIKGKIDCLLEEYSINFQSKIKRGCSEFSLEFPEFEKLPIDDKDPFLYPIQWQSEEHQFNLNYTSKEKKLFTSSPPQFCLSDLLIIKKWIDYARGIDDPSAEFFKDLGQEYSDFFEIGNARKNLIRHF